MNKRISILMVVLMLVSSVSFADTTTNISIYPEGLDNELNTIIKVNNEVVDLDVQSYIINRKVMIPIRLVLDKLGYDITWNTETKSVDISKGAQFTTLKINENYYIKNKMAPFKLSQEPIIRNGRTLVPIEFFYEVLGISLEYKENTLNFSTSELFMGEFEGLIREIKENKDTGELTLYLSNLDTEEVNMHIFVTSDCIVQKELKVGENIKILAQPFMTMIYPAQIHAIIIH